MRKFFQPYALLLPMLLVVMAADARDFIFQHITSQTGLPHQQVEAIAQDGDGFLWFGTRNGLARYDGMNMRTYYHVAGNPRSLGHNFVKSLFVDGKRRLWVCTMDGICRYRPSTNDFANYGGLGQAFRMAESAVGSIVAVGDAVWLYDEEADRFRKIPATDEGFNISVAADSHGNTFVATNSSIFCYDKSFSRIRHMPDSLYRDFLTGADGICPLYVDSRGKLWVGRNGKGVEAVDLGTLDRKIYDMPPLDNSTVRVIREDNNHNMWLGTENGVTIIRADGAMETVGHSLLNGRLLSGRAIYDIFFDAGDNAWVANYFGGVDLLLHSQNVFRWISPGYAAGKLTGSVARMMVEVSPGVIWIATEDGGLNVYDSRQATVTPFKAIPDIGTNVHSLCHDTLTGNVWIGTFRNSLFRYNVRSGASRHYELVPGFTSVSVFGFARQRGGRMWVATTQGLRWYDAKADVFRKLGDGILDNTFVYTVAVDTRDNVWAGTTSRGLFRIDGKSGEVTQWIMDDAPGGLKDNYVTSLYADADGVLWIGTNNNGLQTYDTRTRRFATVCDEPMLANGTVCAVIGDRLGNTWITTSQGLFRFNRATRSLRRFTVNDGLPTNQFNFSSALLSRGGEIFLGTVDGVVRFNPSMVRDRREPLRVFLKQLVINGTAVDAGMEGSPLDDELDKTGRIDLSYAEARSFAVEYGVIMPANDVSVNYQIRVDGVDREWQDAGREHRFAAYNLSPGTYVLRLRANDTNEGWDRCPEKTLKIVVHPPFYRSGVAWGVYGLLLILAVFCAHRLYRRRMETRNYIRIAEMEKNKLEELNRAKQNFFTTVSHELKTPLALIAAPLKSIRKELVDGEDRRLLDMAVRNTGKLEDMVNLLVSFNKMEGDGFPLYLQRGNPVGFAGRIADSFAELAKGKDIQLRVRCEDNGEVVWFAPYYLERILSNLLSNAFKYTRPGGSVSVSAALRARDGFEGLSLEVADSGIGIREEERQRVFERFYQTGQGGTSGERGWGIGLSLVKRLVEKHKGVVELESEVGVGSTFRVWLNVDQRAFDGDCLVGDDKVASSVDDYAIPEVMAVPDETAGGTVNASKDAILVVEDNDDLRAYLSGFLSRHFRVYTARNGQEGLDVARVEDIMLVVSDVMMPGMDGNEMCRRLKADVATSHVPVIMLTAKGQREDIIDGYRSGAEAYVQKPFDPQTLSLQVSNMVRLVRTRQRDLLTAVDGDGRDVANLSAIDRDFVGRLNAFVDANIARSELCVADITAEMGVSRSLLHIKMKNLLNMSAGEFVTHKRIRYACKLLAMGRSVTDTAYDAGFSDPNYFSKKFRKVMLMSPTEYVKSLGDAAR